MGSSGEANAVYKGEAMSPAAQLFHAPTLNCYVIASIGSKTRINPHVIKEGLRHTLLKHPRFTSKLVKKGRRAWWIPTTVDLEKHVIVPEIDPDLDLPDRFIEDYTSNLTTIPLDSSRPLWELHLLNLRTSNSEGIGIFRIHHSLGDGASLISLLLSVTRKASDPLSLPTLPPSKDRALSVLPPSPFPPFCSLFLAIFSGLALIWNTLVDMIMFFATILFLRDSQTPLKGLPGVEHTTKRFVHRNVSLDDIKLVKSAMKVTINDVLLGITQAALARYLNRIQGANPNGGAVKQPRGDSNFKDVRLRAAILFNVRPTAGIKEMADMMAEKSKVKWGNWIGYIILPFAVVLQDDPLKYVRQAKSTIDRKKHSLEAICTFGCAKSALKLFGMKVAAAITHRVLYNTTLTFSNVVGPVEEISFCGHPVTFLAPSVCGHPHALTIHFLSYVNQMTISMAVDPSVIPDPHRLCDDLEASLKHITDVVKKTLLPDIV
ncbi:wax ester synthase/diacylglycerol acyltransferase 11-like isoform X2 [Prosopis cineraria]|uniref:wax ester synthase/diacylglycerol acyltransferase 11-like isoform X2 n=1 Tax=Prosopis cineraria TaxID=364024 RepID=UPI00240FF9F5|nr:wax ester synthase/diacylglycerol acyltransferase 11-like isoform X2 [Prosopis cineraria]